MSKQPGMGDNFYAGGFDVSGDIQALGTIRGGPTALDLTDITQRAFDREGGQRDGEMSFVSYFNPATDRAHERFKTLPTTDTILTYCRGTSIGSPAANLNAKQINYDPTRGNDGSFTLAVQGLGNLYGLEWCQLLTAGKRTDGSATNGASLNLGAASPGAFGLQMYVHLFAFTGTSVTIKIQESSDDAAADAFADVVGATTGALTTVQALRVATAAINVEQYLRVVTTGTFSNAVFAVSAVRNDVAVSF